MKKASIFLATGFEETEAIGIVDVLRRGGVNVTIASITGNKQVKGAHGVEILADDLIENIDLPSYDLLLLPGGVPGADNLRASDVVKEAIKKHYDSDKLCGAICAGPSVFGAIGILDGKKATCYPGYEKYLGSAEYTNDPVTVSGNIITGKGPAFVFVFALKVLENLCGKEVSDNVAKGMLLK